MVVTLSSDRFFIGGFDLTSSRRLSCSGNFAPPCFQRLADVSCTKKNTFVKNRVRASADEQSSPIPIRQQKPSRYHHPFEEIAEPELVVVDEEARLTPAETARTIIEVNNKAALMFSGVIRDEIHENIFWPYLPYMTDEHGNIYFQVRNDEDILPTLVSEDNVVRIILVRKARPDSRRGPGPGIKTLVEVAEFRKAQSDAIAHSAANILSRLKAGGEKTTKALKDLCWRCKDIQAEEATLVGIDTLGFDLRVCSGRQVQTFRFAFHTRASSECSAERQLNDILFPKIHHKS